MKWLPLHLLLHVHLICDRMFSDCLLNFHVPYFHVHHVSQNIQFFTKYWGGSPSTGHKTLATNPNQKVDWSGVLDQSKSRYGMIVPLVPPSGTALWYRPLVPSSPFRGSHGYC